MPAQRGSRESLTADHIIPRSRGGQNVLSNYRVLCGRCNYGRGNRDTL
jgi:5-methylcytosine-specific restriction endonuclease McrA